MAAWSVGDLGVGLEAKVGIGIGVGQGMSTWLDAVASDARKRLQGKRHLVMVNRK